jgi:hypothetical protein
VDFIVPFLESGFLQFGFLQSRGKESPTQGWISTMLSKVFISIQVGGLVGIIHKKNEPNLIRS